MQPRISRRALWIVSLAVGFAGIGTGVFFVTRPAHAIIAILIGLRQGPVGLSRGTEAVMGLYVPSTRLSTAPVTVTMSITDGTSNTLLSKSSVSLLPGGACGWFRVSILGDGSVRINGALQDFTVPEGGELQVLSRVEARVPRGVRIAGTVQVREIESGRALAILPYIEQDN